jgi:hypothetical protein
LYYKKFGTSRDMWPFNRGWPLNGGPLNRGSTVFDLCFHHIFHAVELVKLQDFITDYRQQMLLYLVPYFGSKSHKFTSLIFVQLLVRGGVGVGVRCQPWYIIIGVTRSIYPWTCTKPLSMKTCLARSKKARSVVPKLLWICTRVKVEVINKKTTWVRVKSTGGKTYLSKKYKVS